MLFAEFGAGVPTPDPHTSSSIQVTPVPSPQLLKAKYGSISGNTKCDRMNPLYSPCLCLVNDFHFSFIVYLDFRRAYEHEQLGLGAEPSGQA